MHRYSIILMLCAFGCDEAADCEPDAPAEINLAEIFCEPVECVVYAQPMAELCRMQEGIWVYSDALDFGRYEVIDCTHAALIDAEEYRYPPGNLEVLSDGSLTKGGKGNMKPCKLNGQPYATQDAFAEFMPGKDWANCPLQLGR